MGLPRAPPPTLPRESGENLRGWLRPFRSRESPHARAAFTGCSRARTCRPGREEELEKKVWSLLPGIFLLLLLLLCFLNPSFGFVSSLHDWERVATATTTTMRGRSPTVSDSPI
ncbi:hypothetical protein AOLI_G00276010 [Acnodon oligacanthus]